MKSNQPNIKSLIFIFLLITTGCQSLSSNTSELRRPNQYEVFYQFAAFELNAPELCEKISSQAILTAAWGAQGRQISLVKSDCYENIAFKYGRKDICEHIVPVNGTGLSGNKITKKNCLKEVAKKGPQSTYTTYTPQYNDLAEIFSSMGYTIEDIDALGNMGSLINLEDEYRSLAKKKDITKRISKLAKVSGENIPAVRKMEFLYDLAAHVTNDISWCMKIRDDAIQPVSRHSRTNIKEIFRDKCILAIASNSRQIKFCESIPNNPEDPENIWSIKGSCYRLASPLFKSNTHYGVIPPAEDDTIIELFNMLDYRMNDIKSVKQYRIDKAYYNFLDSLSDDYYLKKSNLEQLKNTTKTREEVLQKIKNLLPDYE